MNSSELEEGQDYPESSLLGTRPRYSYQRPLIRPGRIDGCTRFLLYIFVALQIILLPFGMLYIFAGMESDETMLSTAPDSHHDHEHEHEPVVTSAAELPLSSTSILQTPTATSSSTSSITIASASPLPGLPKRELTNFVDTLIGTEGYGHSFAGSTIPFGMAKAVVDSSTPWQNQAGFLHDRSPLVGMSQLHDEGTGGSPSLGNFPIWMTNCNNMSWDSCPKAFQHRRGYRVGEVRAKVGSFGMEIDTGYDVEMTSSRRTNLYRIKAIDATDVPVLTVGLTDLSGSVTETYAEVKDNFRLVGNGTFKPSFGEGQYSLYFCMDTVTKESEIIDHAFIDRSADFVFANAVELKELHDEASKNPAVLLRLSPMAADEEILVRMATSFISSQQACANAEEEIPDYNMTRVALSSVAQFEEILNRIRVNTTNVSNDTVKLFYSSLYRTLISPQNYTGENPLWDTREPTFDSFYCIWDTFRFTHPLYNIFVPEAQSQMIRSLIDIYRFEGWLPECRMSFCKGITQSGSNADTLLADAYIKGVKDVPWEDAFAALRKDAEVEPENWGVEGRGNIVLYDKLGYVPVDADYSHGRQDLTHRTVSRSIEYAHNDFSIALFARHMRNRAVYDKYISRSSNWKTLWMQEAEEQTTGLKGFFQGRYSNGSWKMTPGEGCTTCFVALPGKDGEFYEESAWSFSWFVPHDYAALIELVGGKEHFIRRLDVFFDHKFANVGNEPGLLQAMLYHYAGEPAKSVSRARKLIGPVFNTDMRGLPGNDDAGSLGAYLVWILSGLFPIAGQSVYLIIPPAFPEVQWTITGSRIITHNFTPDAFIQNVTVNGQPWTKNWISHDFFAKGWTMEIFLGIVISDWGTGNSDVPPSLSTGGFEFDDI